LITVAAFIAAETELKSSVGRKVIEIGSELDERHERLLGKITEQMKCAICRWQRLAQAMTNVESDMGNGKWEMKLAVLFGIY
jgi:cytochrome c-type biogenesis protein CcmH/NrfF